MFLLKTNFKKDLLILFIITIILGSLLVMAGGYITEKYFSKMVDDLIGEYGEYDFIFTLASDKEEVALKQINNVINNNLNGISITSGPRVVGSVNYLVKVPREYKNEAFYKNIRNYFSDIPGLISINIITEPRLIVRGFRGNSRQEIRPEIEGIAGIDFIYSIGDGFDIVVQKPELLSDVEGEIEKILARYKLFEVRYPLHQQPENLELLKEDIISKAGNELGLDNIIDVTGNVDSNRTSLLKSLKQMKTFLLSYASKIIIEDVKNSEEITTGSRLLINNTEKDVVLEVIDNKNNTLTTLIKEGNIDDLEDNGTLAVYKDNGEYVGEGEVNNPRQNLAEALERLNEISPGLNGFINQSEQLLQYSERINKDLIEINEGIDRFNNTSTKINEMLHIWEEEQLSFFLTELQIVLNRIENNVGDISEVQKQMIKTSNNLKEGARLIEEKIIFVPHSNELYKELNGLKNVFLQLSSILDENYDLANSNENNLDNLLSSLTDGKEKISYLLEVEQTLSNGIEIEEIEKSLARVQESAQVIQGGELQQELESIQQLLVDIQTSHLPIILKQLQYIQNSLPSMEEKEIIETINLIDSYIAGEVIPGDQIQLLIKGNYDEKNLTAEVKGLVKDSGVTLLNLDAGLLQKNPRGEIFNLLRQVKAVISTIIALIFTLFVLIMDQSLIISIIRLNNKNALLYSLIAGGSIYSLIYYFSRINFPYLNLPLNFIIGGLLGLIIALFSGMLNPVSKEEWEAGKSMGFSFAEIMHEIIIPAGKPGLLYLLNYPKVIFR